MGCMSGCRFEFPVFFGKVIVDWNDNFILGCRLIPGPGPGQNGDAGSTRGVPDGMGLRILAYLQQYESGRFGVMDLPLALHDVPAFTARVLLTVAQIPPGEVRTYREVACALGSCRHARAVGQVMARNRWPLLIPCHRVVGTAGPGGYGPGLDLKERLLRHEGYAWPAI